VILLVLLALAAAYGLYSLGIINFGEQKQTAAPAKRPQKKGQVTGKVQKKPAQKTTKPTRVSSRKPPAKKAAVPKEAQKPPVQAPPQAPAAKETAKGPAVEAPAPAAADTAPVQKPSRPLRVAPKAPQVAEAPSAPQAPQVAKAPPAPQAQPQTPPAPALSAYPYAVYLGSYRRESLENAMAEYRELGLTPYWVELDLGDKGTWYRIFAGSFPNRVEAEAFIREKQIRDGESRNTRYANLIGVFRSEGELQELRARVEKAGFFPYAVQGPEGQWMLYTGAFYQKFRAEKQNRALRSKGIQGRLVER